ncbi:SURF1 family protein [Motiliproteus sp. SC1-56]|uniref:SURF1 family protein n=1 Tax=Motiliproteus sp. SC1-56 TaxID=2799565 RepID=UPI001A8E9A89|nr:SURF1 family protein [Motiliproteus sp. SC1-56]
MAEHLNGSVFSKAQGRSLYKLTPLLLAALFIPLCLFLAGWQWQKAERKSALGKAPTHYLQTLPPSPLPLEGAYRLMGTPHQKWSLLLDNRTRDGRAGYEVLVPFTTAQGPALLINLGWVAAPAIRDHLPQLPTLPTAAQLQGRLLPLPTPPTLGSPRWSPGWPKRVQTLDIEALRLETGLDLLPRQLRLDRSLAPGFDTRWPPPRMTPARHQGYALQWALLALALTIMSVYYAMTLRHNHERR